MRKKLFLSIAIVCVLLFGYGLVLFAQDAETESETDWKQEFQSDISGIKEQRDAMKDSAQAAREEEKALLQQIDEARAAGDFEKAKQLRDQLHATHQENVQQKHEGIESLKEAKQEMRADFKEAKEAGELQPPAYNPPGTAPVNPPGYNPPGKGPGNPPGYNPPGKGPGNPPGRGPRR